MVDELFAVQTETLYIVLYRNPLNLNILAGGIELLRAFPGFGEGLRYLVIFLYGYQSIGGSLLNSGDEVIAGNGHTDRQ